MKLTPRFMIRAGLVLSAAGALGAFGACSKDKGTIVEPPPPPPAAPAAPINLAATVKSATQIDVAWTDASDNEDGFKVESCSGANCTNFAEVGSVAANTTTFSNTGLTANTDYTYRVKAFNTVGASAPSSNASAKTQPLTTPPPAGIVMVGAGEITSCLQGAAGATAAIVDGILAQSPDAIVFTAGNNLNSTAGTSTTYTNCFDPTWGKFKTRLRAAVGQADFASTSTDAVYNYFGDRAGAPNGYYSFDAGTNWHVVVLNTATWQFGKCAFGQEGDPACAGQPAPEYDWLNADLTANTKPCIAVVSWQRRFYVGTNPTAYVRSDMRTITHLLTTFGADLMISASDHVYARFAPMNYTGGADPNGIRQFIVGTGGRSLENLGAGPPATLEASMGATSANATNGVLKLTLNADSYDWEFIPTTQGGFTDKGTTKCH